MKKRIRNILIESLILESPLFRSVAIKYKGKVYEGEPGMTHGDIMVSVLGTGLYDHRELSEGFITVDGKYMSRDEAEYYVKDAESKRMKRRGELAI
jgi:hypothetical protein